MDIKDKIIMTYVKLKLNLSYFVWQSYLIVIQLNIVKEYFTKQLKY